MRIHNFFADILLSTRMLFSNYIFDNDFIKKYEFNFGNRAFQFDSEYKTGFEFPVIIVSVGSQRATFGKRTSTIRRVNKVDMNHIVVLYNNTNKNFLSVQEEETNIGLSIVFNCESQFQAKEIEYILLQYLPLDKYIMYLKFTSFFEISRKFLNENEFDVNKHDIVNLYTKFDENTGVVNYCFSLQYEPLLKNNSITVEISDSTQRSFQVRLDLDYVIQQPLFLFNSLYKNIEKININYGNCNFEPISRVNPQSFPSSNEKLKRQLLITDTNNISNNKLIIQFEKNDFIIHKYYSYKIIFKVKIYNILNDQVLLDTINNKVFIDLDSDINSSQIGVDNPLFLQFLG